MFNLFKQKKEYQEIQTEEFAVCLHAGSEAVILDVRTSDEFAEGCIPGAMNVDVMNGAFLEQIEKLDREKPYYVYCRSGMRSGRACRIMTKAGFANVNNLKGGILAWTGQLN